MKDNCRKLALAATTNTSCSTTCPHTHGHSHTQPHRQLYTLDMRILLCTERVSQSPLSPLYIQYHPFCPHMYPVTHTHGYGRTAYVSLSHTHTHIHTHTRTRYTTSQSQQTQKQFHKYLRTQVQGMSPNPSGPMPKACTTQPASPATV